MSGPVSAVFSVVLILLGVMLFVVPALALAVADFVVGARNLSFSNTCYTGAIVVSLPVWLLVSGAVCLFLIIAAVIVSLLRDKMTVICIILFDTFFISWSVVGSILLFNSSCVSKELYSMTLATLIGQWIFLVTSVIFFLGLICCQS